MTPEEKLGEIMGQQHAIATLLAQLMISCFEQLPSIEDVNDRLLIEPLLYPKRP